MEGQYKPKVKFDYPRPGSPSKAPVSVSPPSAIIRPRAKVTSSAKIGTSANVTTRKPASSPGTTSKPGGVQHPRAPSPLKAAQPYTPSTSSSISHVKARLTARPNGTQSSPSSPAASQWSLAATAVDHLPTPHSRPRGGSISYRSPSPSRPAQRTPRSVLSSPGDSLSPSSSVLSTRNVVRVKSKISRIDTTTDSTHSAPTLPSPTSAPRAARMPSISNLPAVSDPARPQRFATTRESHRPHLYQPFPTHDDHAVNYSSAYAKPDPAAIPLPPHSPPMSTLSFSSRSSASRSSLSYDTQSSHASRSTAPTLHSRLNAGIPERLLPAPIIDLAPRPPHSDASEDDGSTDGSVVDDDDDDASRDSDADADSDDPERKRKAAAKSNRKIADLEITTRSLLAINSSLEATKRRQAKEIRDLRRKLRESRLILPPPAFRAVTRDHDEEEVGVEKDAEADADADEEDEEDEEMKEAIAGKNDAVYSRVLGILDALLDEGRRALEATPADFVDTGKGGARVLSEEEVRDWRGDDPETRSLAERELLGVDDTASDPSRPLTPSRVAVPDSDGGFDSEYEVEASLLEPDDVPPVMTLPPIMVTHSP